MEVVAGGESFSFDKRTERIRVDEFDVVTMNGEAIGFTTLLGRDWDLWQAYREFYCNALDEGGGVEQCSDGATCGKDETIVCVCGKEFERIYTERYRYFLEGRTPIVHGSLVDVYRRAGSSGMLFLKGVRVSKTHPPARYDYDFHGDVDLTEDRTIKYSFQPTNLIQRSVQSSVDEAYIERMVLLDQSHYEGMINYADAYRMGDEHGDVFLDVVGKLRVDLLDSGINESAIKVHQEKRVRSVMPAESCELTDVEKIQLRRATSFCRDALRLSIDDYPLIVIDHRGDSLGRADIAQKIMYVTRESFSQGTKMVAIAILEEFVHVKHKVGDETPQQKWVYLKMIAELGERLRGEPL